MADNQLVVNVLLKLVDEMSNGVKSALDKSKGHLDSFAEHAQRVGQQFAEFGRTAALAGGAITGALGVTVKQFADLEQGLAQLKSTMSGKDGVSANFQAVSDLAIKLGNQLPGNTQDFAGMINKLLQLGVTEQDVLGGVGEAAAKFAAVMRMPYEQAAEVAAKLKEATGTANEDMLKFMDTLQRVGHQGVSATDMMYAFARSAGGLKQFGLQGEQAARQVSALFGILIKSGLSGETAGTNLNTFLNTLAKFEFAPTNKMEAAAEQLRSLGVELDFFDNKTKEFKGVENLFAQLEKLRGLDQEQATVALQNIFGGGMDQQIAALLSQGGVGKFAAMQDSMANQADLATRSAVQLQTLSAKWEAAFGTFQNLLAKIGELLAPKLGEFVDWFGSVSERIQKWIDNNQELAGTIVTVIGGLGTALAALGAAGLTAAGVASVLGAIATGFSAVATAAGVLAPALAALAANPVFLAILGIGVAAATGWAWGSWLAEQIDIAVQAITGDKFATLGTAIFDLVEGIRNAIARIPEYFKERFNAVAAYLRELPARMKEAGAQIIQGLIDGIKAKATEMVDTLKGIGNSAVQSVKDLLKIKSPSEVMIELGQQTAEGFSIGLKLGTQSVAAAAAGLAMTTSAMAGGLGLQGTPDDRAAYHAQVEAQENAHQQRLFDIRSFWESQSFQYATRYRQLNLDSSQFFFSQLGALMTTKSKSMFEIGKAAAIAETIISTYKGAQLAFAALAGIPYVGPFLGAAAAAAAIAAGMAKVSAIKSTKFGGASASPVLSGGGVSGPVVSAGTGVAVPPTVGPIAPQALSAPREVNVYLRGTEVYSASAIRDSLIPALNEALGDGVKLNVRGM